MPAPATLPKVGSSAPPAVLLESSAPVPAPAAIRMDVAAFVGRVKPGRLAAVTAVESAEAFAAAFTEAPDSRLGPAVRAFFRNGGRRCWVVPADPPFFDERLQFAGAATLVREAAMMDDSTELPKGVHAVLALEEVTLLAVPDAFPPRPAPSSAFAGEVATSGTPGGTTSVSTKQAAGPTFGNYKVPDPEVLVLDFKLATKNLPGGHEHDPPLRDWVELSWSWRQNSSDVAKSKEEATERAGAQFVLVRSVSKNFPPTETDTVYRGTGMAVSVSPEPANYRVRAETAALVGGWAVPQSQPVPIVQPVTATENAVATQIAAVKVCAARGDMLAVLSPPESWPDGAGDWAKTLASNSQWGFEDSQSLQTHAAFWGPWVLARDGVQTVAEPDAYPADGAVCGLFARRAVERGAWASILNLPVAGALGLGPAPYGPGELVPLFAAESESTSRAAVTGRQSRGINALARTPRGFVPVGERTACADPIADSDPRSELVPLRRFMALLRRTLARVGVDFAFASNGPALERRAVRAVECVLEDLLRRGALVGPDARSSFQVSAWAGNPDAGTDDQLILEVRVRPALPLRVLTIRLIRTGDGAFTVAEGQV